MLYRARHFRSSAMRAAPQTANVVGAQSYVALFVENICERDNAYSGKHQSSVHTCADAISFERIGPCRSRPLSKSGPGVLISWNTAYTTSNPAGVIRNHGQVVLIRLCKRCRLAISSRC